eukprot:GILK01005846.1.p1 GENE.GILK01005846.1~~GILK01005846.1.p1  ORF type:complete len:697 (+),score=132.10 GILK01005846.1:287-2092(+)
MTPGVHPGPRAPMRGAPMSFMQPMPEPQQQHVAAPRTKFPAGQAPEHPRKILHHNNKRLHQPRVTAIQQKGFDMDRKSHDEMLLKVAELSMNPPLDASGQKMVPIIRGGCVFYVTAEEHATMGEAGAQALTQVDQPPGSFYQQYMQRLETAGLPPPGRRMPSSYFSTEEIRSDLLRKNALILAVPDADSQDEQLPQLVSQRYHSLLPLDDPSNTDRSVRFCGLPSRTYKAINIDDGMAYALKRLDGFRPTSFDFVLASVEVWSKLQHPCITPVRQAFITKDFSPTVTPGSLVYVYDYIPGAVTLEAAHLRSNEVIPVSETVIWAYVSQLVSALRSIHSNGLAARVIDSSKIILSGRHRIRLSCVGILDVLKNDRNRSLSELQQQDLIALGRLILSLACGTSQVLQNVGKTMETIFMKSPLSAELKNLVIMLLSKPSATGVGYPTVYDISTVIQNRTMTEFEHALHHADILEGELAKELDNGRLFRLQAKLGLIMDRPEDEQNPSWSETGDRYLLKLFKDYLYHQQTEDGSPLLDLAHVVDSLNKLDVGDSEQILLMSQDQQSLLVASYRDLKRCVENAFNEMCSKHRQHALSGMNVRNYMS